MKKSNPQNRVEIIKVQLPLDTTEQVAKALMYNESKSFYELVDISQPLLEIMEGEPKKFFYAAFLEDESFHVIKEAKPQGW